MAAKFLDKTLLGLAALLVIGAGVVARQYQKKATPVLETTIGRVKDSPYVPANIQVSLDPTQNWPDPVAQKSSPDWIYDVFTSPYVYLTKDGEFKVVPPITPKKPQPFGVGYVGVKPSLYRLQLLGTDWEDGFFKNEMNGETIVARAGRKLPDLDLEIRDFQVKNVPIRGSGDDPDPTTIRVAVATLFDSKTQETVVLTAGVPLMTGTPLAILKITAGPDKDKQLDPMKLGTTFEANGATYHIDNVTDSPNPVIEVTKQAIGDSAPATKKLVPPSKDANGGP